MKNFVFRVEGVRALQTLPVLHMLLQPIVENSVLHGFGGNYADGSSWQRMISRLELCGPISMECPASIYCLKKGVCYVSGAIAKPFGSWHNGIADRDILP